MTQDSKLLVIALIPLLFGCSAEQPSRNETAPLQTAANQNAYPSEAALSANDLLKVCRIGHAFTVGREPSDTPGKLQRDGTVRISYTRDDGKSFRYDCKIEANVIRTRMIDEGGPGTGPGAWSGRGSTTTFAIAGPKIKIRDVFFDGSTDEQTYPFR